MSSPGSGGGGTQHPAANARGAIIKSSALCAKLKLKTHAANNRTVLQCVCMCFSLSLSLR